MGGSPQPFLVSLEHFHRNKGKLIKINKRSRRINVIMKRRRTRAAGGDGLENSTRPRISEVERKLRTLKKLVPNSNDTMGLDGLFSETADYILAMEMKIKVMKIMVKVLSCTGTDDDDDDNDGERQKF